MKRIILFSLIVVIAIGSSTDAKVRDLKAIGEEAVRKGLISPPPKDRDFTKIPPNASYKPGELLVRFAPRANGKQRTKAEKEVVLASIAGGAIKHSYHLVPGLTLVKLPQGQTVQQALQRFNAKGEILYAEPNYEVKALQTIPNDTRFGELWGLHNTGQEGGTVDADIDAPEAWDIATDASAIVVAVIDSGVDYNHEDLAANMWKNEAELNGTPGFDDDDNGYVDDIYGYDFYNEDGDPMDDFSTKYHGTHCAGTVGAVGNNDKGVTGVCWTVRIMALKFLNASGVGPTDDAIKAVEYSVLMGADLSSNSWGGGPYDQGLTDAIDAAGAAGMLFVAAAGNDESNNDTTPFYPASFDCESIISVMSTDRYDNVSEFSNWGAVSVDLAAPGSSILSCKKENDYQYLSGTSMAAPHVAGACALMWARSPDPGHLELKDVLLDTVDKPDPNPLAGLCVSNGRLNLHAAVFCAGFRFTKDDGLPPGVSLMPGDYVTYTITYGSRITDPADPGYIGDLTDVYIIDYLPQGIDSSDVTPSDGGVYDSGTNTVTWYIPTLAPREQLYTVTVRVRITDQVEPAGVITNLAVLEHETFRRTATITRPVGCFGGDVIYVNRAAAGCNNGISWTHAYTDLQSALARAAKGCGTQIWVAAGTYKPTTDAQDWAATFQIPDGVALYGGFPNTGDPTWEDRDWVNNETILTGDVDGDDNPDVYNVVTASDVSGTTIDGFTLTKGSAAGLYCNNASSMTISHNNITENGQEGISCTDSSSLITDCLVQNSICGITTNNSEHPVTVQNSRITANYWGIHWTSDGLVKNNWIYGNDDYGIYCWYSDLYARNNTIAGNGSYAIKAESSYPIHITVDVDNCIMWGNTQGAFIEDGLTTCTAAYSCIQGGWTGDGNIDQDPLFENPSVDDYHLQYHSPCKDTGDPLLEPEPDETDIDGEDRILDGDCDDVPRVDMGADEINFCWNWPTQCHGDADGDGWVKGSDFLALQGSWYKCYPDPDYNPCADFDRDGWVRGSDFLILKEYWYQQVPADCDCGGTWPPQP